MRTTEAGRGGRPGMTLIEIMVALVILSGSLIAMGNFMGKFTHAQRLASLRADAIDIASNLIDSVGHDSSYAKVPTDFARTVTTTRDNATFTRVTTIKQIGGGVASAVNYYIVTTAVTWPGSPTPVKKSIVIHP
jgi:prepilin-type N-terminal cleavage/methylation domain-containing protein